MIKVEEGKYYKTRGGEVVGPAESNDRGHDQYPWIVPHLYGFHGYRADGVSCLRPLDDLIEEWYKDEGSPTEQQEPTGHSIDMLKAIKDLTESYGYSIKGYSDDGDGLVTLDLIKKEI